METATLFRTTRGWFVQFHAGPRREEVVRLFQTDVLPLPWTAQALYPIVLDHFQQLNPGITLV